MIPRCFYCWGVAWGGGGGRPSNSEKYPHLYHTTTIVSHFILFNYAASLMMYLIRSYGTCVWREGGHLRWALWSLIWKFSTYATLDSLGVTYLGVAGKSWGEVGWGSWRAHMVDVLLYYCFLNQLLPGVEVWSPPRTFNSPYPPPLELVPELLVLRPWPSAWGCYLGQRYVPCGIGTGFRSCWLGFSNILWLFTLYFSQTWGSLG